LHLDERHALSALRACLALRPLLRVELILIDNVLGEVLAPRYHGALVRLGDGELALAVALPLLGGDKVRWGHQHLRLGGGVDIMEVEVVAQMAGVLGTRGLMRGLEGLEG
jgi:hypothetical protein